MATISFPDDIFKCIFLTESVLTSIQISLKFVSKGPIYIIPALVQIMAWRRPGDKPLSEPMVDAVVYWRTRTQWVNSTWDSKINVIYMPLGIACTVKHF